MYVGRMCMCSLKKVRVSSVFKLFWRAFLSGIVWGLMLLFGFILFLVVFFLWHVI